MITWSNFFSNEKIKTELSKIEEFRKNEEAKYENLKVFPKKEDVFKAFKLTPFQNIKVVLCGQDTYHGEVNNEPQAQGLCFSVPENMKLPPSLKNIFKELVNDINCEYPKSGDLTKWGEQGVLLLNRSLSVLQNNPNSHKKIWNIFSKELMKFIVENKDFCIFICWGNDAFNSLKGLNLDKHIVLKAYHPSPLAGGKFFGCKHFSKCNDILISKDLEPIDWSL